MQQIVETLYRVFGGLLLLLVAFAPAWILFDLAKTLFLNPGELNLVAAVAFLICAPLLYFFLLLAYRAFTGRGRKQDGGLLPPLALKICAGVLGAFGIAISIFALVTGEVRGAIGGLGPMLLAVVLYRVVRDRERVHAPPAE